MVEMGSEAHVYVEDVGLVIDIIFIQLLGLACPAVCWTISWSSTDLSN